MKNPFLIGTNVYLRALERADAPALVPWFNDPEVTRTLAIQRPVNLQSEEEFLARIYESEHDLVLGIMVKEHDAFIGVTGLHRMDFRNRHACFGISIGDTTAWGNGYGTEATSLMVQHAFETLNLNRVWLHVFDTNERGLRAYEKVGFKPEGVLRQEVYRDGRYANVTVMGLLREEWDTLRSAPR